MSIVRHESWFSRLAGSIKGIFAGGLIALIAIPLMFWNEGRAVYRARTLAEGREAVIEDVPIDQVDGSNEGKLVHMTGTAESHETLTDDKFAISVDKAIKLERVVEMFQWHESEHRESKKKLGGGKTTVITFEYRKEWSQQAIDSSNFEPSERAQYGEGNPPMPFQNETFYANEVDLGAFQLSEDQIRSIHSSENVPLNQPTVALKDDPQLAEISLDGDYYYIGKDPQNPNVGDIRVKFREVGPTEVSLIYKQAGNSFAWYKTPNGTISIFREGKRTADELFTEEETINTTILWAIRLGGFVMMAIGIGLMLRPLAVLSDVVPFFGGLVGFGVGIIAILVAAGVSLVTISIAWLFYRPLFAIALIAVAAGLFFIARTFLAKNQPTSGVLEVNQPVVMD